jgi:hypothetical protein
VDCGLAGNTPVVVIQQAAEKRELPLLIQDLDLHEIRKLPSECLHVLVEPRRSRSICERNNVFMLSLVNCDFSSPIAPAGSRKRRAKRRADAGLRPGAFEQDAVEDFNLIEMVALRFKELPPLVDGRFHNRVVICCERYVGAVRFEEVLVNMEAWAKRFERRFQPLHRILLLRAVKTFVVHAGNAENHADIAALGKEGRLIPEAVEVDVVVESRTLFPRLDDLIETQHHTPPRGELAAWRRHSAACSVRTLPGCGGTPDRCSLPNGRRQNRQ